MYSFIYARVKANDISENGPRYLAFITQRRVFDTILDHHSKCRWISWDLVGNIVWYGRQRSHEIMRIWRDVEENMNNCIAGIVSTVPTKEARSFERVESNIRYR